MIVCLVSSTKVTHGVRTCCVRLFLRSNALFVCVYHQGVPQSLPLGSGPVPWVPAAQCLGAIWSAAARDGHGSGSQEVVIDEGQGQPRYMAKHLRNAPGLLLAGDAKLLTA